jgi:serine/threonine protein kinase/TolB-like protein/Tfp pilus assembly protein PilF
MILAPGTRFGAYEILGPIGEGGMGVVYRARDPRLERQVAIKLLPHAMAADRQAQDRLRLEAKAAAALDHPYICKIFEIGRHQDTVFLVMEFVAGETLTHHMQTGRMPPAEILDVAGEIIDALQTAHAGGILHRDLKPSNIMLIRQGHIKIMDFGLAKRMDAASGADDGTIAMAATQLTMPGSIMGTPAYMSPEQVKGLPLTPASDLFSFGVILAEMACGIHPFETPSMAETLTAVLRDPPRLSRDLSPGMTSLLDRLLAKDPAGRYATAAEVRADLSGLATGQTIPSRPPIPSKATPTTPHPWQRPALIAASVLAIATTLYSGARLGFFHRSSQTPDPPIALAAIRSIAVLPLKNHSGDPSQDYFAEGMTDELTSDLATVTQLRVTSRGSAMQFKDNPPATPIIAKALNVDAVLEGSVLRSGNKVRITAELTDARTDKVVWSKPFERNSSDVLTLQDELASAIAAEVNVQLTPTEQSHLTRAQTVDPEAHDAYLKGRYSFNRPDNDNLKNAIRQFTEAIRLSPNFAPAYSGLSDAYLWAGYNEDIISSSDAKPKARAAAEKAVQLDPSSAEAHASLATYKLFYDFDWPGCEAEFRHAIALNPSYAFAHDQFGLALAFQGRLDESRAQGKIAAELDPLDPQIAMDRLFGFAWDNQYDVAMKEVQRAAELDHSFFFPPWGAGWVDLQAGNFSAAIPQFQKSKALPSSPTFVSAFLAYAYAASGDKTRALAELEDLKKHSPSGKVLPFNLALVYLGLGDHPRALDYLEQAHASDSQWMGWLKEDHIFDSLHSEPRYIALLRQLNFIK